MTATTRPLAVTMGDPAGIGPEILVKAAAQTREPLLGIGDLGLLERTARGLKLSLEIAAADQAQPGAPGRLAVLQVGPPLPAEFPQGRASAEGGAAAFAYLDRAIGLALAGQVAAIVTCPIAKDALALAGVPFPGHTEILAHRCGGGPVAMMLANDDLRVLLVSIHLSLADAIARVTPEAELRAIRFAHQACRLYGLASPRIAVAGLNPHAGEGGMFGREEIEIIGPAIAEARAEGLDARGPFPPDTVFMRARQGEFDIVVAQYHDQGLIPVKYLGVEQGVNVTVGLPFVRTSVDHGTAFDIAGQGRADPSSLLYAIGQALRMTRREP